jgi:hypothetical protein
MQQPRRRPEHVWMSAMAAFWVCPAACFGPHLDCRGAGRTSLQAPRMSSGLPVSCRPSSARGTVMCLMAGSYSSRSFAVASSIVCQRIFSTASVPPLRSGIKWSAT